MRARQLAAGAVVTGGIILAFYAGESSGGQMTRTSAPITGADLSTRVHIFADDSMQGRLAGSEGNRRATNYIAAELTRLRLDPGGVNGSYFMPIPPPAFGGRSPSSPDGRFRNVVAIIRGSDPVLRGEFIALGAHHDHVGTTFSPVDHDSARVAAARAELAKRFGRGPTAAELAAVGANLDSLRRLRPVRMDSINNGADDDGSGSMALLEIAEYFASLPPEQRPRRSVIFVWHSNEEIDLGGSMYFVRNATVPVENIIAQINVDMVGRGGINDVDGGGPDYLAMVGSRRVSTRLGDIIDSVNTAAPAAARFALDYSWDALDHPEQIYSRSDHYSYAQAGIPVAFVFTALHIDYHRVTDEPQYLNYAKLEKVTKFVSEIVKALGAQAQRPPADRR